MKTYIAPELIVTALEVNDIITNSQLATSQGDNNVSVPAGWWD